MITPMAVIDFLAFAPSLIFFGQASGGYALRLIRLLRVLRLLKLGRYFAAIKLIERAGSCRHDMSRIIASSRSNPLR